MTIKHTLTTISLASLFLCSTTLQANNFSFTGNFSNDNDIQLFNFSINSSSTTVNISTLSLNGGANSMNDVILAGGFNPYLAMYNQLDGAWLFDTSSKAPDDESVISNTAPYFYGTLAPGDYIIALTQFDNLAAGSNLSDGFANDLGLTSFNPVPFTTLGGGGNSYWALDILNVDTASLSNVPSPDTLILSLIGLIGLRANIRSRLKK